MTFPRKGLFHVCPILSPPLMKNIRMNIQIQGNFLYGTLAPIHQTNRLILESPIKIPLVLSDTHDTPPNPLTFITPTLRCVHSIGGSAGSILLLWALLQVGKDDGMYRLPFLFLLFFFCLSLK